MMRHYQDKKKIAFHFVLLMGIVSLFGDITYEGARSIIGPYLAILGASATVVGLASGLGEFVGYGLRLISGYIADKTKMYWLFTVIGYGLILSIPLLAFAGHWEIAVLLIILERMGKAIRTPARDAILSHVTTQIGRGLGFGIHEALDQVGAFIGPLVFSVLLMLGGEYRYGFIALLIPAILTLIFLMIAKSKVPLPEKFERTHSTKTNKLPKVFWFYMLFTILSVIGFANFPLISYHLKVQSILSDFQIPILYAIAMGVDALIAVFIGRIYDKIGLASLITIPLLSLFIPFFAFSHSLTFAVIGMILWGSAMGIQETIMRAAIGDITPIAHRGFAYGIFNAAYGASLFVGSTIMGLLYDVSIKYIIVFVIFMEMLSIFVFLSLKWQYNKRAF